MIPTHRTFNGTTEVTRDGILYSQLHRVISTPGEYRLNLKFISSNSKYIQSIGVCLFKFKGTAKVDGDPVKLGKRTFTSLSFYEDTAPKQFTVDLNVKAGDVCIFNDAYNWWITDDKRPHPLFALPAMIVTKTGPYNYVFHCNDHEYDDDFDDLVFSLDIEKVATDEVSK